MSRKKLSEFRAKTILFTALDTPYNGVEIDFTGDWQSQIDTRSDQQSYVVKVDQAIKGRFKKGLVKLQRSKQDLVQDVQELANKGFEFFLVEPFTEHAADEENYLSLARTK